MKKLILIALMTAVPNFSQATNMLPSMTFNKPSQIPSRFLSSEKTESLQWGCPIAETVQAMDTDQALEKIGQACMDDVRRAAVEKPGVFDVINVSVVWPDLQISRTKNGFKMEGTLFLETLVMKGHQ